MIAAEPTFQLNRMAARGSTTSAFHSGVSLSRKRARS
jgi:hypothetical protein